MKIVQVYLFIYLYLPTYLSIAGLAFIFVSPGRPADAVRAQDSVQPWSAKNFRLVLANHCGPRRHISILAGPKIAKFEAWAVPRSFIGFVVSRGHTPLCNGVWPRRLGGVYLAFSLQGGRNYGRCMFLVVAQNSYVSQLRPQRAAYSVER